MRKIMIAILLIAATGLFAQPAGLKKDRLAVMDLVADGVDPGLARRVSEVLRGRIINLYTFDVVERSEMDELVKEMELQQMVCTDDTCIAEMGKQLAANKMLVGKVMKLGSRIIISVRIVDVETGRGELSTDADARSEDDLYETLQKLAVKLRDEMTRKAEVVRKERMMAEMVTDPQAFQRHVTTVEEHIKAKRFPDAEEVIRQMSEVFTSYEHTRRINELQTRINEGKARFHYDIARDHYRAERYLESQVELERALALEPYNKDFLRLKDDIRRKLNPRHVSRTGAFFRSFIMPGWGQLYNEQYVLSAAYLLAAGGAYGFCIYEAWITYWADDSFQSKYERALPEDNSYGYAAAVESAYKTYEQNHQMMMAGLAGGVLIHAASMVHASLRAKRGISEAGPPEPRLALEATPNRVSLACRVRF